MSTILYDLKKIGSFLLSLILPVLLFLVVTILWYYLPFTWLPCIFSGAEEPIQFGDRFEAVNALFAGLAFAGVIYAILLQKEELGLQRNELEMTRAEVHEQSEQLKSQAQTLQKQNFESSFFQLLGFHNEIVNSVKGHIGEHSGREYFDHLLSTLKKNYEEKKKGNVFYPKKRFSRLHMRNFLLYFSRILVITFGTCTMLSNLLIRATSLAKKHLKRRSSI